MGIWHSVRKQNRESWILLLRLLDAGFAGDPLHLSVPQLPSSFWLSLFAQAVTPSGQALALALHRAGAAQDGRGSSEGLWGEDTSFSTASGSSPLRTRF